LTGAAVDQGKPDPAVTPITDFAFSYLLVSELTPFKATFVDTNATNFADPALTNAADIAARKVAWSQVQSREQNTSEIKLTFQWPLLDNDRTGPNRQSFRALISGERKPVNNLLMFSPQTFVVVPAP
jgi:hypothetical protein